MASWGPWPTLASKGWPPSTKRTCASSRSGVGPIPRPNVRPSSPTVRPTWTRWPACCRRCSRPRLAPRAPAWTLYAGGSPDGMDGRPLRRGTLHELRTQWDVLRHRLAREVNRICGVFVPTGLVLDPQSRVGAAVLATASARGLDPYHLAVAVDHVWRETRLALPGNARGQATSACPDRAHP